MSKAISFFFTVWVIFTGIGLHILWQYDSSAGSEAHAPMTWPANTMIHPSTKKPTLVVLLHPRCSCSTATVEMLARLAAQFPDQFESKAFFYIPKNENAEWGKGSLWSAAQRIPSLTPIIDQEGREAEKFGALTSGHIALYDQHGHLLFSGGITPSRGHEGDSAGSDILKAIFEKGVPTARESRVFGCGLFEPGISDRKDKSA